MLRSRICRHGGIVQVGQTQLAVQLAEGGLASRSYGMPLESDFGWAVRLLFKGALGTLRRAFRTLRDLAGGGMRLLIPLALLGGVALLFLPGLRETASDWFRYGVDYGQGLIDRFRALINR